MGLSPAKGVGVMPKFNLYPYPNPDGTNADSRIEVGWSKWPTGDVRVATTVLQPGADRNSDLMPSTPDEPYRPAWDGRFVGLDRNQVNELIRRLRRARDEAFGADE
jgi:hypothetical protein